MAEIVNLKQVKKRRGHAQAVQQAAENRVLHGRTKAAKANEAAAAARAKAALDGKRT